MHMPAVWIVQVLAYRAVLSSTVMSSLAVLPPTVPVPGWGGGLVIWLRPEMPAENGEYCHGLMHWPVHFLSLANGLPLRACGSAQL